VTAALVVLLVAFVALIVWNVSMNAGYDDDSGARRNARQVERAREHEANDRLIRLMLDDLRDARSAMAHERAEHVAQLTALLRQQAEERRELITAALSPAAPFELARLEIHAEQAAERARAHDRMDERRVMAAQDQARAEARFQDITS